MTQNFTDKLMREIKAGQVTMRPRWHFVLRGSLIGSGLFIAVLAAMFLSGFLIFALRVSGILEMPVFGWRGYREFLLAFPWLIAFLLLALMLGVELYTRRFSFSYRYPVLGSIVVVFLIVVTSGLALDYYLENNCPSRGTAVGAAIGRFRSSAGARHGMIHVGKVRQVGPDGYVLAVSEGDLSVIIDSDTRLLYGEIVEVGDEVIIFGESVGEELRALGVRSVTPNGPKPFFGRVGCGYPDDSSGQELMRPMPDVMFRNR